MNCPKCKSSSYCKDGIVKERRRYKCKECNYRYTVEKKSDVKSDEVRRFSLELYLEGVGFRSIGRLLKISHVSAYNWIKEYGEKLSLPQKAESAEIVELDEMQYLCWGKKNYKWIWIAVDRFGKRFIAFVCGDRSTKTGLKIWDKLKDNEAQCYCSDYWKSYEEFIPAEKHVQTKAETFTVEGYNSRIRHYLARFRRRGKCYSKAVHMIEKSLNLLMLKLNKQLSILN